LRHPLSLESCSCIQSKLPRRPGFVILSQLRFAVANFRHFAGPTPNR
jgi:hypothetical protein